jgi:hypothetical protein
VPLKARGKKLGNPKLADARKRAVQGNKLSAARYAANVLPVIREIQASGVKSLRGVARALAARGIATARGGAWTPVQVSDILRRSGWLGRQSLADVRFAPEADILLGKHKWQNYANRIAVDIQAVVVAGAGLRLSIQVSWSEAWQPISS